MDRTFQKIGKFLFCFDRCWQAESLNLIDSYSGSLCYENRMSLKPNFCL